jgi:hypothetical protein
VRHYETSAHGFVLEGSHDGFAHLPGNPVHVRRMAVSPSRIEIEDRLDGQGAHTAAVGLLLHSECAVTLDSGAALVTRGDSRLRIACDAGLEVTDAVWWPDMGVEQPARRLVSKLPAGTRSARTHIEVLTQ